MQYHLSKLGDHMVKLEMIKSVGNVFFIVQLLMSSTRQVVTTTTIVHIGLVLSGKTILYTPLPQKEKSGILI